MCKTILTSMKGEINNNTMIVRDFITPLTCMDRSTKQKINKEAQTLNDTIGQLDLVVIYRTFHPQNNEFHLFLKCTRTFSSIDHILALSGLDQFKKIEIILNIFSWITMQ